MGDKEPGRPADDLVFVIAEKPHSSFTRSGNDLHTTVTLPLKTALTGGSVQVRGQLLEVTATKTRLLQVQPAWSAGACYRKYIRHHAEHNQLQLMHGVMGL